MIGYIMPVAYELNVTFSYSSYGEVIDSTFKYAGNVVDWKTDENVPGQYVLQIDSDKTLTIVNFAENLRTNVSQEIFHLKWLNIPRGIAICVGRAIKNKDNNTLLFARIYVLNKDDDTDKRLRPRKVQNWSRGGKIEIDFGVTGAKEYTMDIEILGSLCKNETYLSSKNENLTNKILALPKINDTPVIAVCKYLAADTLSEVFYVSASGIYKFDHLGEKLVKIENNPWSFPIGVGMYVNMRTDAIIFYYYLRTTISPTLIPLIMDRLKVLRGQTPEGKTHEQRREWLRRTNKNTLAQNTWKYQSLEISLRTESFDPIMQESLPVQQLVESKESDSVVIAISPEQICHFDRSFLIEKLHNSTIFECGRIYPMCPPLHINKTEYINLRNVGFPADVILKFTDLLECIANDDIRLITLIRKGTTTSLISKHLLDVCHGKIRVRDGMAIGAYHCQAGFELPKYDILATNTPITIRISSVDDSAYIELLRKYGFSKEKLEKLKIIELDNREIDKLVADNSEELSMTPMFQRINTFEYHMRHYQPESIEYLEELLANVQTPQQRQRRQQSESQRRREILR